MKRTRLIPIFLLAGVSFVPIKSGAQAVGDSSSSGIVLRPAFPSLVFRQDDGLERTLTFSIREESAAVWRRAPAVTSFFCRNELLLERKSILAPRFRLGSLAYTEWMEGKRASYRY